jgi:hypothetical protein
LLWKRAPASKPTLGYGKGPILGPRSSEAINRHATGSAGRPFCEGPEVRRERKVHRDRCRASKWKPRLDSPGLFSDLGKMSEGVLMISALQSLLTVSIEAILGSQRTHSGSEGARWSTVDSDVPLQGRTGITNP